MRKHALLQDRLGETEAPRRTRIGTVDFNCNPDGAGKNCGRILAQSNELRIERTHSHVFGHDRTKILATGRLGTGLFLDRRGMHRARIRARFGELDDPAESAVVPKEEPGSNRDEDGKNTRRQTERLPACHAP